MVKTDLREDGISLAFLGFLFWASRYILTPDFCLYEDDLTIREFWTKLLPLISDAQDGNVISVAKWESPPRVYRLEAGWEEDIVNQDGIFELNDITSFIPDSLNIEVPSQRVIFVESQDSGLVRRNAPLLIAGTEYPVKQFTAGATNQYPPGDLYNLMILDH